jgi:hypothetical protein
MRAVPNVQLCNFMKNPLKRVIVPTTDNLKTIGQNRKINRSYSRSSKSLAKLYTNRGKVL